MNPCARARARTLVRNAAHREITGGAGGEGGLRASYFNFFYVNGTPRARARARVTAQPNLSGLGRKMNRADLCSVKSGRERERERDPHPFLPYMSTRLDAITIA